MASKVTRPKVVLITGASGGIGAALACELARSGHALALVARRIDRLERVAEEAKELGASEALVISADLADPDTPPRLIREVVARFGRIDVLINNAGFGLPEPFAQADPEEIREQIEVNLTAPVMLTRLAIPHLIESRGMIINVGSAITAIPNPFLGAYGLTKAGLAYWNDALRNEMAVRGVRVCLVEPGPVRTEFFEAVRVRTSATRTEIATPPMPGFITADVRVVAARVARLLEHPRRRLDVLKRLVWPWRILGGLFRICPPVADAAMRIVARNIEPGGRWSRRQGPRPVTSSGRGR